MSRFAVATVSAVSAGALLFAPLTAGTDLAYATTPDPCATAHTPVEPTDSNTDGTFEIGSVGNLVYVSVNQDSGDPKWRTRDFVQTANINLEGCVWTPLGTRTDEFLSFTGTYDGGGFAISNLYTNDSADAFGLKKLGLFGSIDTTGTVRHVHLVDAVIESAEHSRLGSLAGENFGTIESSSATGRVTGTVSPSSLIGGLVGSDFGTLRQSSAAVTATGTYWTGGLVGATSGAVTASFATGDVTSSGVRAGGLVGNVSDGGVVTHSYATGNVTGDSFVGGLAGGMGNGSIANSYSTGTVTGNSEVGGFVGGIGGTGTVTDSFWNTEASGVATSAGGAGVTGKTTAEMKDFATFESVWPIVEGWQGYNPPTAVWGIRGDIHGGYPYLLWRFDEDTAPLCGAYDNGTYTITTAAQLAKIGVGGASGACALDDTYIQAGDITLTDPWTALGGENTPFVGTLNGGGFTVSGMAIPNATTNHQGFFAAVGPAGDISNLTLDSVAISGTSVVRVGALAGLNQGTIRNVTVSGSISLSNSVTVGGLVGVNQGTISDTSATVSIFSSGTSSAYIGGLIGLSETSAAEISDSEAHGSVTSQNGSGGLVGYLDNGATLTRSHATGSVLGEAYSGGLVGLAQNGAVVSFSHATGSVTGESFTGGLIGYINTGSQAQTVHATGDVVGEGWTGGLAGVNQDQSTISTAFATGSVTGVGSSPWTGGLVGVNQDNSNISDSYATGSVSGGNWVGGLAGLNQEDSTITNAFSTGQASGDAWVGGLVGLNQEDSTITNTSSTGSVSGQIWVGGLAGLNQIDSTITNSFSAGTVVGVNDVGGLVGLNQINSSVVASFYDATVSGLADTGKGVGITTAELRQLATFSNEGWSIASCRASSITTWGISPSGTDYPFLVWANPDRLTACPVASTRPSRTSTATDEASPLAPSTPQALRRGVVSPDTTTESDEIAQTVSPPSTPTEGEEDSTDSALSDGPTTNQPLPSAPDTGWLWAIGLGGLFTVVLIGGALAWARARG